MKHNLFNKPPLKPKTNNVDDPKYIQDEIGLKIKCFKCQQYYYVFQISDHYNICIPYKQPKIQSNSPPKINSQPLKSEPKQELEQKPPIVPKQLQIPSEQQQQILVQQKQHNKQQIAQLNRFEQAKTHLSKVVEAKKSRLQNKIPIEALQQEFEAIICPFCRKKLQLDELDHADNCAKSTKCEYCEEKIAISLKNSHYLVCIKRLQKQYQREARLLEQRNKITQKIQPQKKQQKIKPNLGTLNKQYNMNNRFVRSSDNLGLLNVGKEKKEDQLQKPKPKVQQKISIKKSPYKIDQFRQRALSIKKQEKVQKNQEYHKIEVEPEINQHELDMKSRIRALKKKGIPQNILKRLPRGYYKASQFENQIMCPVGFQDFNQGEKLIKLMCSHIFHEECLFPYLKDNISCPVCKKEISL